MLCIYVRNPNKKKWTLCMCGCAFQGELRTKQFSKRFKHTHSAALEQAINIHFIGSIQESAQEFNLSHIIDCRHVNVWCGDKIPIKSLKNYFNELCWTWFIVRTRFEIWACRLEWKTCKSSKAQIWLNAAHTHPHNCTNPIEIFKQFKQKVFFFVVTKLKVTKLNSNQMHLTVLSVIFIVDCSVCCYWNSMK